MKTSRMKLLAAVVASTIAAILCMGGTALAKETVQKDIHQDMTLQLGKTKAIDDIDYFYDNCSMPIVTNTNSKVAALKYNRKNEDFRISAEGFGKTTITIEWVEDDDYMDYAIAYTHTVDIVVKDVTLTNDDTDLIFTGKTYTAKKLSYIKELNIKGGKFVKGAGYKVVSGGSKITPTKTGAVNVKYEVGDLSCTIKIPNVHSYEAIDKVAVSKVKKSCWRPNTFRLISKKRDGIYCDVKFSAENLFHDRITQTVSVGYKNGKIQVL